MVPHEASKMVPLFQNHPCGTMISVKNEQKPGNLVFRDNGGAHPLGKAILPWQPASEGTAIGAPVVKISGKSIELRKKGVL